MAIPLFPQLDHQHPVLMFSQHTCHHLKIILSFFMVEFYQNEKMYKIIKSNILNI